MLREWLTRLRFLVSPKPNREIDDELQFHIERQAQEYIETGMAPQEARRKAVVAFGGIESVRAQSHEQRPSFFLGTLLQDVIYALRQLRKSRGFSVTAVLTLALGIGANAAIFTLVNAILLKNLPVVDPSTLIRIGNSTECCVNEGTVEDSGMGEDGSYALFATDTWQQLQKNTPEFEELAAMESGFGTIIARPDKSHEAARSVTGEFVSGNYFLTFGLQPSMGRLFTDADNVIGAPLVAVMSYDMWQNNYAGDPSIVGSTFWINTKAVTITGIAPKGFYGDRLSSAPPDFYLPIESLPVLTNRTFVHEPGMRWLYIIGRLKPGVAMAPLQNNCIGAAIPRIHVSLLGRTREARTGQGPRSPVARRRRHSGHAGQLRLQTQASDGHLRARTPHRLRQYRQPSPCPRDEPPRRDVRPNRTWREANKNRPPAPHGKYRPLDHQRDG
jgi:macrolide transport system ATP-binding/permease protein